MSQTSISDSLNFDYNPSYRTLRLNPESSIEESAILGVPYNVLRLTLEKYICDVDVDDFGRELSDYYDNCSTNLALDFRNVRFLNCGALGKMIYLDRKLTESGRKPLRLKKLVPEIFEVFDITKLDKRFDIDKGSRQEYQEYLKNQGIGLRVCND
jgi:anti-anti-sigma regulatory factor